MNRMAALSLCFILVSALASLGAQTVPEWQWAERAGGEGYDYGLGIAADNAGNLYVTGFFRESAGFGGTILSSLGDGDVYVSKLDTGGNFRWTRQAGGPGFDGGRSIVVDASGSVFLTGDFAGTAQFGDIVLTASGEKDAFVCKLDAGGNFLWASRAGGFDDTMGMSIALDSAGNCYIAGLFSGSATFGSTTLVSQGYEDAFLARLDVDGNFIWARRAGGCDSDMGNDLSVDNAGNCLLTGGFSHSADFGPFTLTSEGEYSDLFVCKLDAEGNFLWARQAGGEFSVTAGCGIAADAAGNSYVTGVFQGSASFGDTTLTSGTGMNNFVCKLDPSGNFGWARQAGWTSYSLFYGDIAVDGAGNCCVTGAFQVSADFGPITLTSNGATDIFACALDPAGNFLWARQAGSSGTDWSCDLSVDAAGNCCVTGMFTGTASFGPTTLASSGGADIFIARLGTEVAVEDETTPPAEGQSRLYAAWPNPSGKNRLINLKARVAAGETGTLSIYNLRGELIGRQDLTAGEHQIDLDGRSLPAGMYVYRLRTSTVNTVKKLIIR